MTMGSELCKVGEVAVNYCTVDLTAGNSELHHHGGSI